jgi:hypothetical protein
MLIKKYVFKHKRTYINYQSKLKFYKLVIYIYLCSQ